MQEQWRKAKKWSGELLVRAMGFERTCSLFGNVSFYTSFLSTHSRFLTSGEWPRTNHKLGFISTLSRDPLRPFTKKWKPLTQGYFSIVVSFCLKMPGCPKWSPLPYNLGHTLLVFESKIFTCETLLSSKSTNCDNRSFS